MNSKLRFYLRGLGVGLVVTTLILMAVRLNTRGGQMTDAEIKARAAELGMVEGNSYSLTDAVSDSEKAEGETKLNTDVLDAYNTEKPSETESYGDADILVGDKTEDAEADDADVEDDGAAAEDDGAAAEEDAATEDAAAEADQAETEDSNAEDNTTADAGQIEANETTDTDVAESDNTTTDTGVAAGSATITIASGSASETAAATLEKAGVITDAKDFNSYMCKNGYDRRIHPGTYTIEKGATYEEICKIIAG